MASTSSKAQFSVRPLQVSDCPKVRQLLARVNLNFHEHLNEIVHGVDQGATYVAHDLNQDIVLGICSGVNLSPSLAHFGQFVVLPEYRGQGIGTALSEKVLEHIGSERNITLYSSPKMIGKYKEKGFRVEPNINLHFFIGKVNGRELIQSIDNISVVPINDAIIQKVIEYDRQIGPDIDRKSLIEGLSASAGTQVMVAMNDKEEVVGYCVVFPITRPDGRTVLRAEQNYANNGPIAELLLAHCLLSIAGSWENVLIFRCYQLNQHFMDLAQSLRLEFVVSEPLLYSKEMIKVDYDRIFSPSFGTTFPY